MGDQSNDSVPDRGAETQNQKTNPNGAYMVPKISLDEVNGKLENMAKELDALVTAEVDVLPGRYAGYRTGS